jgi:hypothetical protein
MEILAVRSSIVTSSFGDGDRILKIVPSTDPAQYQEHILHFTQFPLQISQIVFPYTFGAMSININIS